MESNLHIWVKHITEQDLPIFNHTARAISELTQNEGSSPTELANAILQDTTLTARILRIANSPVFNRHGQNISTVSKAVMYIGFQRVRDLSLSLAIIDTLLQKRTHDHALNLLARSFHAAVIARNLVSKDSKFSGEEYFIATLLLHLGEMAFWCLSGHAGDKILSDIQETGLAKNKAEQQILGTDFIEITRQLNKHWKLSELLSIVLDDKDCTRQNTKMIKLAHNIAQLNQDQEDHQLKLETLKLADELDLRLETLNSIVDQSKDKAIEITSSLGATGIVEIIKGTIRHENKKAEKQAENDYPESDSILQLTSLRKLTLIINEQPNINRAIQAVLEGLHHGIGLDRAAFILFDHHNKTLRPKFCYGLKCQPFSGNVYFRDDKLFSFLTNAPKGIWLQQSNFLHTNKLEALKKILHTEECFIATLSLNQQPIGVLYADRQPSQRSLDETNFEGFVHFSQQAQLAINHIFKDKSMLHHA